MSFDIQFHFDRNRYTFYYFYFPCRECTKNETTLVHSKDAARSLSSLFCSDLTSTYISKWKNSNARTATWAIIIREYSHHLIVQISNKKISSRTHLKRHFQSIHMKVKIPCELNGCNSRFAQKNTYRNHIISHHKDLGEEGTQYMLKKIREMQLPTPSFESVNYTEEIIN